MTSKERETILAHPFALPSYMTPELEAAVGVAMRARSFVEGHRKGLPPAKFTVVEPVLFKSVRVA
jgi:hypothetical protein